MPPCIYSLPQRKALRGAPAHKMFDVSGCASEGGESSILQLRGIL